MFGAFRPSAPLSGGLLWKIPWRLSRPQKLRQRRRLRRVDNIVAVLDSALQKQALSSLSQFQPATSEISAGELSSTAEGQRTIASTPSPDLESRRHGRGPHQSELVQQRTAKGLRPTSTTLGDAARREGTMKLLERWKSEMPTEQEMLPRDKYTMFDRKAKHYRKGVHKLPKWTRVSQRLNPPGY